MKKKLERIVCMCLLLGLAGTIYSQRGVADSLTGLIRKGKLHDSVIVKLYNLVGEEVYSYQPDSAIQCWETAAELCDKNLQKNLSPEEKRLFQVEGSAALNNIGYVYQNTGEALLAIKYLKKSLLISRAINDYNSVAIALNNIGHNLANIGNNVGALDYYNQNLEVTIKYRSKKDMILSLIVLGDMYGILKDEKNALAYMNKALKVAEELNDKRNQAYIYTLLGNEYFNFGKQKEALKNDSVSLKLYQQLNDLDGICTAYNNIGARYYALGKYEKALVNFKDALFLREKLNDLKGRHSNLINIGATLFFLDKNKEGYEEFERSLELARASGDKILQWVSLRQIGNSYFMFDKNYKKSEEYGVKALELASQLGFPDLIRNSALLLTDVYKKAGDYKKALDMQTLFMKMRDSLVNTQTRKASINSQLKYEYEIKAAADSVRVAADKKLSEAKLEQEETKSYALYGGMILTVFFGGFMFNRYKKTNRQRIIIEQQEKETQYQKGLLENKNKEILDSINYAKRLQEAILPPENMWMKSFNESFILYKPKDIVAGDFYWMEYSWGNRTEQERNGEPQLVLFAAADCTGHGVPGAMVSVVCANALTRTVNEFHINEPGKILDKVRELVIQTFEKSESEVKDGMDISLCSLNTETRELKWAGANNPLWIIRNNAEMVEEIKADKQPIGSYSHPSPFKTHSLMLEKGDCIYVFTDGFADQFGGPKVRLNEGSFGQGKKFKTAKMKELLLSHHSKKMEEQKHIIHHHYESWRGNLEQIDDVCVIGVKI